MMLRLVYGKNNVYKIWPQLGARNNKYTATEKH